MDAIGQPRERRVVAQPLAAQFVDRVAVERAQRHLLVGFRAERQRQVGEARHAARVRPLAWA